LASRGSVILLFALMRGERWGSPAQEGIRGWGRHLRSDPGTAVKPTFALTHPIEPARDSGTRCSIAQTERVAVSTDSGLRRGVKTVPSRSNA
jgi:hypothetical protein